MDKSILTYFERIKIQNEKKLVKHSYEIIDLKKFK